MNPGIKKCELAIAVWAIALILCSHFFISDSVKSLSPDAVRYADYSLNLVQYGVFGLTPADGSENIVPGNANAPLYPMFIAGIVALDDQLEKSLVCVRSSPQQFRTCPQHYQSLVAAQYVIIWLTVVLLWLFVRLLFNHRGLAALSVLFAFLSLGYTNHAHDILTEIFVWPGVLALQLGLLLYIRQRRNCWVVLIGLALGFLTLTRPEYLYLALAFAISGIGLVFIQRTPQTLVTLFVGIMVFSLSLTPWLWRNHQQMDTWALTGGGYAETILAYRLAYNDMSAAEWGAAFTYWFPDFGDSLARKLLPESSYRRLVSDNEDSFSAIAIPEILAPELERRPREEIVGYWIRTEILGKPLTHAATTIPLIWRGIFVRKYWGIIGFFAYTAVLVQCLRRRRYQLAILGLPVWFMVVLYASISVSIPRYNLPLIPLYSIGWAWVTHSLIRRRWKPDWVPIERR